MVINWYYQCTLYLHYTQFTAQSYEVKDKNKRAEACHGSCLWTKWNISEVNGQIVKGHWGGGPFNLQVTLYLLSSSVLCKYISSSFVLLPYADFPCAQWIITIFFIYFLVRIQQSKFVIFKMSIFLFDCEFFDNFVKIFFLYL